MVILNLKALMSRKGISRYKLQQLTNWNYKRINSLYFNKMKYLTLEEIEILCKLLECGINELIILQND